MHKAKSSRILLMAAVILIAVILMMQRHALSDRQQASQATTHLEAETDLTRHGIKSKDQPALDGERKPNDEIWGTGKPFPVLEATRGLNKRRQYGAPLSRKLPEVIANSTPSVMAMIPADGRQHLLPHEIDPHTLRARRMVLNPSALDRIVSGETKHLLVPTPGTEVLDLEIDSIRTRTKQTHSLIGKIAGEELSDVNIVYHDGIVHGTVARYEANQHFEYRILPDGHMMVRELDAASMTDRCTLPGADSDHQCAAGCIHGGEEAAEPQGSEVEEDTTGWTTIDVVVGYGSEARIADWGVSQIEARIIASVDRMSTTFSNSLVTNTELMLLGTIEDPSYVFPGPDATTMGSADELGDLNSTSDGVLDAVTDYSSLLGADLTSFVVKEGQNGSAGIAYRPGRSSVVSRTSMTSSNFTFVHELGHNLGAKHSLGDGTNDNVLDTARYGLRFEGSGGGLYRTVMAYNNSPDYSASRVPHFANPNVNYDGTPTGVEDGVNLTGNALVDPVYVGLGFDGSNPDLGARNAEMFLVSEGSNGTVYASNRSTRAAPAVTSPVSSDSWLAGTTQTITFLGGDMDYTASFELYKNGSLHSSIPNSVDAIDHQMSWTIPMTLTGDNDYAIRMTLTHETQGSQSYMSDTFTIVANDSVTITSPVGGETWRKGEAREITWYSGLGGNVHIELYDGSSYSTIDASTPNDGSYIWSIPGGQANGSDYKLRVSSLANPAEISESPSAFTIADTPSSPVSLPYTEGFEAYAEPSENSGDWTQSVSDERNWEIESGGTPSGGTGPAGAYAGTQYLYLEASDPVASGDTAVLTCWFDLTASTSPEFRFQYNMSGPSMGVLLVEAQQSDASWKQLFAKVGDQGTDWLEAVIDLTDYSGMYLQLRITAVRGSSWSSDIAIDELSILETASPYEIWAGVGVPYTGDANADGVSNGLAWLLGAANPTSAMSGLMPEPEHSSGDLLITFSMLNAANRGSAVMQIQYSNDLGATDLWTNHSVVIPDSTSTVGGIGFVITPNGIMNDVQASIPMSEAASGKLFGRLSTDNP